MEAVNVKTKDGIDIAGDYYGGNSIRGILLLHMMPATKESWRSFAEKLQLAGFKVLAIDLRGHGESRRGPNGYKNFSSEEHQKSIIDVEAAVDFLRSHGARELNLAGASIGANLALWYSSEHPDAQNTILLSPGLNYKGIATEQYAAGLRKEQRIYYAAAEGDARAYGPALQARLAAKLAGRSAADMARKLYGLTNANKSIKLFKGESHGTNIFKENKNFEDELIIWLKEGK